MERWFGDDVTAETGKWLQPGHKNKDYLLCALWLRYNFRNQNPVFNYHLSPEITQPPGPLARSFRRGHPVGARPPTCLPVCDQQTGRRVPPQPYQ